MVIVIVKIDIRTSLKTEGALLCKLCAKAHQILCAKTVKNRISIYIRQIHMQVFFMWRVAVCTVFEIHGKGTMQNISE